MKIVSITCDWCGADLNCESPMPEYFLTLYESPRPTGSFVYAVAVQRQLPHEMHFCGKGCLTKHFTGAPAPAPRAEGDGQ